MKKDELEQDSDFAPPSDEEEEPAGDARGSKTLTPDEAFAVGSMPPDGVVYEIKRILQEKCDDSGALSYLVEYREDIPNEWMSASTVCAPVLVKEFEERKRKEEEELRLAKQDEEQLELALAEQEALEKLEAQKSERIAKMQLQNAMLHDGKEAQHDGQDKAPPPPGTPALSPAAPKAQATKVKGKGKAVRNLTKAPSVKASAKNLAASLFQDVADSEQGHRAEAHVAELLVPAIEKSDALGSRNLYSPVPDEGGVTTKVDNGSEMFYGLLVRKNLVESFLPGAIVSQGAKEMVVICGFQGETAGSSRYFVGCVERKDLDTMEPSTLSKQGVKRHVHRLAPSSSRFVRFDADLASQDNFFATCAQWREAYVRAESITTARRQVKRQRPTRSTSTTAAGTAEAAEHADDQVDLQPEAPLEVTPYKQARAATVDDVTPPPATATTPAEQPRQRVAPDIMAPPALHFMSSSALRLPAGVVPVEYAELAVRYVASEAQRRQQQRELDAHEDEERIRSLFGRFH